jgi:hypothetical protein
MLCAAISINLKQTVTVRLGADGQYEEVKGPLNEALGKKINCVFYNAIHAIDFFTKLADLAKLRGVKQFKPPKPYNKCKQDLCKPIKIPRPPGGSDATKAHDRCARSITGDNNDVMLLGVLFDGYSDNTLYEVKTGCALGRLPEDHERIVRTKLQMTAQQAVAAFCEMSYQVVTGDDKSRQWAQDNTGADAVLGGSACESDCSNW